MIENTHAARMLSYVPSYYEDSRIYHQQNDTKGREFDFLFALLSSFEEQTVPQTATWSLPYWERLCGLLAAEADPIADRRARIVTKLAMGSPMTRELVKAIVYAATGARIETKTIAPYTENVEIITAPPDTLRLIAQVIEEIKPAHLLFSYSINVETEVACGILIGSASQQHIEYEGSALEHHYKLDYEAATLVALSNRAAQEIVVETQERNVQERLFESNVIVGIATRAAASVVYEGSAFELQTASTHSGDFTALIGVRPSQAKNYEGDEN